MEDETRKSAALDALRTWRTYADDRDRLIVAAKQAEATIADIVKASGLAKGTVRAAIAAAGADTDNPPPEGTDMNAAPITSYHHPHFVRAKPGRWEGDVLFEFRPFTGHEPDPQDGNPYGHSWDDESLSAEDRQMLSGEYEAAHILWGQAKFKLQARPLLEKAAPIWQDYQRAHKAMDATFAAFWDAEDTKWRAQILRLADTHTEALAAAGRWDEIAEQLSALQEDHLRTVGETHELLLRNIAPDFGMDIRDWDISYPDDYRRPNYRYGAWDTPLVKAVREEAERQKARLKEVGDLAGDH